MDESKWSNTKPPEGSSDHEGKNVVDEIDSSVTDASKSSLSPPKMEENKSKSDDVLSESPDMSYTDLHPTDKKNNIVEVIGSPEKKMDCCDSEDILTNHESMLSEINSPSTEGVTSTGSGEKPLAENLYPDKSNALSKDKEHCEKEEKIPVVMDVENNEKCEVSDTTVLMEDESGDAPVDMATKDDSKDEVSDIGEIDKSHKSGDISESSMNTSTEKTSTLPGNGNAIEELINSENFSQDNSKVEDEFFVKESLVITPTSNGLSSDCPTKEKANIKSEDGHDKKITPLCQTEEGGVSDMSCKLLVFDEKDLKSTSQDKLSSSIKDTSLDAKVDKESVSLEKDAFYTQAMFEDISEDESNDESYENIELELDDLIDANDVTPKNNVNCDKEQSEQSVSKSTIYLNGNIEHKSSESSKSDDSDNLRDFETESQSLQRDNESLNPDKTMVMSTISENRDPSNNSINFSDQDINPKNVEITRKKFTARKSGKPVTQMDSAPLKRINMYPIKDITMNLPEIEDALDLQPLKSKKEKKEFPTTAYSLGSNQQASTNSNTYRVISVTKSSMNLKKKRRKNTYDFPGCKKRKKGKLSDDVASSGASSVDSISLSDGDVLDLDTKDNSFSESLSPTGSLNSTGPIAIDCSNTTSSSHSSLLSPTSSSLPTSTSPMSPPFSGCSPNKKSKGSNKIKSVLDMLHERNKKKAAALENSSKGPTTSTTTTTTTTIVSIREIFSFLFNIYLFCFFLI